ncbi:MAG: FitA-like ribbon-helix-helix domain-containing protein [Dermatophilaceae bacterium]
MDVTIPDVPDQVRDELASRATRSGVSLQEYLRGVLIRATAGPADDNIVARTRSRVEATDIRVSAESILAARDVDRR